MIKRNSKGEYILFSLRTGRRLGVFKSKLAAQNRERQIQYFKHKKKGY